MSFNLDSLFIEWRRIVPTGVPNPKNAYHLTLLKEICLSKGISTEIVDSVMLVMEKEEKNSRSFVQRKREILSNALE